MELSLLCLLNSRKVTPVTAGSWIIREICAGIRVMRAHTELPVSDWFLLVVQDLGQEGSEEVKRGNWAQISVVTDSSLTMSLTAFIGNWTIKWHCCSNTECLCAAVREADLVSRLCGRWGKLCPAPELWMGCTDGKAFPLSNKIDPMISGEVPLSSHQAVQITKSLQTSPYVLDDVKIFQAFLLRCHKMRFTENHSKKNWVLSFAWDFLFFSRFFHSCCECTWTKLSNLYGISAHT